MSLTIRKATADDKEFVIEAIVESETSGSDTVSYCAIFSIDDHTFRKILSDIFDEEVGGQELCIANFLIAEVEGERAAAISAWIEKEEGLASNIIKSNLFMHFMDRDVLLGASANLALMNEINIQREDHALQIECVYTAEKFRGRGLVKQLINEHIAQKQKDGAGFSKVQIVLMKNNASAIRSYEKAGFAIVAEKQCANDKIFSLLGCDTKILMEKSIALI